MNRAKNEKVFTVKYKDVTGEILEGTFTVKRLSVRDRSQIGMRKSQLSGGMYCVRNDDGEPTGQGLDEDTEYLNGMIAHLEVSLIQKPSWFNLAEIADLGLVREVYEKVWEFETSFFRIGQETGSPEASSTERVGGEDSGTEHPVGRPGNGPTPVVDEQVQASLDA